MTAPEHGIIASHRDAEAIFAAGADYLEPTIVGNVVVQDSDARGSPT